MPSLQSNRQQLFELHSYLRSVDNLRPDEALDQLARLLELWARNGAFPTEISDPGLTLSPLAASGAISRLEPLLEGASPGRGGDLFQELADVGVRAGMGQYFTPPPVAEAVAAFLKPASGELWLDPFCGSGLLLGAIAAASEEKTRLFGIDRDARVLNLARVEAMMEHPGSPTTLIQANALEDHQSLLDRLGAPADGVDGVVANPPFGAEVHEADRLQYSAFELSKGRKTGLEILGLEQCLRLLRPGGRLGIVLPQSVLSNRSLARVREFILKGASVDGVLSLPPDTFLPFKGVGKASVLFLTKEAGPRAPMFQVGISRSIGWDAVGRPEGDSDVVEVARSMADGFESAQGGHVVPGASEFIRNMTAEWLSRPVVEGPTLGELCESVYVGRTPGRAAYKDIDPAGDNYRMLKVGDLTNQGVDWTPGERSIGRLAKAPKADLLLRVGDLAMTASAHHPRYIAAKVDYIDTLPDGFEDRVLPVAEVLVLRPLSEKIDPLLLLLWLRSGPGRRSVQACVTGQTAHLNPKDVADVAVPHGILDLDVAGAAASLTESLRLRRLSESKADAATLLFEGAAAEIASPGSG